MRQVPLATGIVVVLLQAGPADIAQIGAVQAPPPAPRTTAAAPPGQSPQAPGKGPAATAPAAPQASHAEVVDAIVQALKAAGASPQLVTKDRAAN